MNCRNCKNCRGLLSPQDQATYRDRCEDCWAGTPVATTAVRRVDYMRCRSGVAESAAGCYERQSHEIDDAGRIRLWGSPKK